MKNLIFKLAAVAIVFGLTFMTINLISSEKMQCDQVVFLEGEMSIDIKSISSYANGVSHIWLCDGTEMDIPTYRIIKIVKK